MLYSHNLEHDNLSLFTIFLNNAIQGREQYVPVVNQIILETHMYSLGKKDLYSIDKDYFHIVLTLSANYQSYFERVADNPQNYNEATYAGMLNVLTENKLLFKAV